jgi:hypothetical protein
MPIARLPMAMHDRDNEDEIRFSRIEDRIRKHLRQTTPDILFDTPPTARGGSHPAEDRLDAADETQSQSILTTSVMHCGPLIF